MPTDGGDPASEAQALRAVMDELLAKLSDEDRANVSDRAAYRWLGMGMRLGLERPSQARRMLELIETGAIDRLDNDGSPAADASPTAGPGPEEPGPSERIPVCSRLLSRSASMSKPDGAGEGPESRFGWAAMLTRDDILSLGRTVDDLLAAGSPPDIARGFGIAWDAGVSIPRGERDELFAQFAELEVTVGGVMAGRDLRADQRAPRSTGLEGLFASLLSRPRVGDSQASAAIEQGGDQAKRGLVALWNAWVAMRFRALIPRPTFELLVEPWVTVVGPLPEL